MQATAQVLIFVSRRLALLAALGGLALLSWYSVLFARADVSFQDNNPAALRNAVRLVPGNAAYHALLAEHMEGAGANPDTELEIATELSPRDSRYWIRRAFRAEVEQQYGDSERYLLAAKEVDNGFDPRSALMNFYFRRGRMAEFWTAAHSALEMSYGSLDPIFRLCLAEDDDPAVTRKILPPKHGILLAFLTYLLRDPFVGKAAPMATEVAQDAGADDVPTLLEYCDRRMGQDPAVLTVWNALCRRRLVPFAELAPEQGKIITNGDFTAVPLQQGFDWKHGSDDGISITPMDEAQGVAVDISGKQPDVAVIFQQPVPLTPGRRYMVSYEYRVVSSEPDSGLRWAIQDLNLGAGPESTLAESRVFSATDWNVEHFEFPSGSRDTARILLRYRRLPGTLPWKGTLQVRRVTSAITKAPETPR